jgi:hypothetical protein
VTHLARERSILIGESFPQQSRIVHETIYPLNNANIWMAVSDFGEKEAKRIEKR